MKEKRNVADPELDTMDKGTIYNGTVIGREEINPQLIILRVKPDGQRFSFQPGQFAASLLISTRF